MDLFEPILTQKFPLSSPLSRKMRQRFPSTCFLQNIWSPSVPQNRSPLRLCSAEHGYLHLRPHYVHSLLHLFCILFFHLLEVTFHLGVGKVETEGNREVKFPLRYLVSLCLEFTCWVDFTHKNMSISFWSSTGCSLILQVHFFQKSTVAVC